MNGAQKAAAVLLAMGRENAERLSGYFSAEELQAMVDVAANLPGLDASDISGLVGEFGRNYERNAVQGRSGELSKLLDSVRSKGTDGPSQPTRTSAGNAPEPDEEAIAEFFEREPPVYSAILIDALKEELTAKILGEVEASTRNQILGAYLNRKRLDAETESQIASDLLELVCNVKKDPGKAPQIEKTAGLINFFTEEASDELLGFIGGIDPELATQIRAQIFRFNMVTELERPHLALLFDGVDSEDVVAALSGAEDALKETVLDVLSQRTKRMVEAELARGGISEEKTQKARRRVSALAIDLAKTGKITLPGNDSE
jgi:flagellar motor switch protein FliG